MRAKPLFGDRDASPQPPREDLARPLAVASTASLLPSEPGSGQGRPHGTSSRQPFDRWFRYPAGFASDYAALLLDHLNVPAGGLVVDCFAGSGVIGTAARAQGMRFCGIEAHPLIAELAALKLSRPPDSSVSLEQRAADIAVAASQLAANRLDRGDLIGHTQPDLVRRCFTPECLERLIALKELTTSQAEDVWMPYLKWALLGTLRDVASARVGWPYQRPAKQRQPRASDPFERFQHRCRVMAEDLAAMASGGTAENPAQVVVGDAREPAVWTALGEGLADGCVSSPPYLNNFDYADATRLELYFWGEITSWSQMCATVRAGMITATTQQTTVRAADQALAALEQFGRTGTRIAGLTDKLRGERGARKRGKEYDRVVPDYFVGIAQVLERLRGRLRPGAPCVWLVGDSAPYGIHIDTPQLIGELAEQLGYRVEADILLRHRGRRWATSATRHRVELSERLLLFRRLPGD